MTDTDITLLCDACRQPVLEDGYLCVKLQDVRMGDSLLAEVNVAMHPAPRISMPAPWAAYHSGCDPRGREADHRIDIDAVRSVRDLLAATLDLLGQDWVGGTDWRAFCRRTLAMSPR